MHLFYMYFPSVTHSCLFSSLLLGLPKSVMTAAFDDLIIILLTWSDNRELAQEIAKAGFVQIITAYLTAGLCFSSIIPVS